MGVCVCVALTFLEPTVLETEGRGLGVAMDLTSIGDEKEAEDFCVMAREEEKMKLLLQMYAETSITIKFLSLSLLLG